MPPVAVRILHAQAGPAAGPLERVLVEARAALAERHRRGFLAAGAADVRLIAGPPDGLPFGARLRGIAAEVLDAGQAGLVVLGSGAMPLASDADRRSFVRAASEPGPAALANNVYSADVVAISGPSLLCALAGLPDLPTDNALPRWLAEVAEVRVTGLDRWRLAIDLDSPLDLLVAGRAADARRLVAVGIPLDPVMARLAGVRAVLGDRRAELIVAGRTSAGTLRALERGAACRIRALVEERGLRASSRLAFGPEGEPATGRGFMGDTPRPGGGIGPGRGGGDAGGDADGRDDGAAGRNGGAATSRPPRSILGLLVDRDGPEALGGLLAQVGDAAVVDTRVLLAHRYGPDEAGWPPAEDRFAADLLLPDWIADPWLRSLITSLRDAPIPILAGGHTLVGPGIRLLATRRA